ncbi:ABC transporter ATP-binding protein [Lachnoclostridium phytofermentans]|uniref:Quaternary amine transport ATP-binding protein n=1 Tax=Lachnoclostridium phytofermentans (strain ATCC 700394 / DSM 18823 / ISDg) TaxID=357809 RepID=A9KR39_LACP7|nr:ABC transporter ATP-binding protein [Lachnoclostridium phytofermentans]ABX40507.1 glycine betaine/L-proline ABC transporter, ATPase subunit [Lachnoclostridium phytofermentans ISDg]
MIKFTNITKSFKSNKILKDVTFNIDTGNLVAIIGESGCGKTTLLKMINRLIKPTSGSISIDGEDILSLDEVSLRRKIGYVIQQTGLFPHMTIKENIEIIPKILKVDSAEIMENTKKLMNMVGLDYENFIDRYPSELSGGQQQRVGVARAFANNPDIILMDEPFSALDPMTRSDLQDELVELQSKLKKTIVFVTHDMDEAIKIADKICIMREGRVLQYDTPENILKNPVDDYVSNFVGKNRIWSSPEFIKVHDFMMNKPVTATKDLSILKCIDKMRQKKVDSLLIINPDNHHLHGILKASQIRSIGDRTQSAENFMVTDFPTLNPDNTIVDALKLVTEQKVSTIPVTKEDGYLVGLVTRGNLVTTLSQQYYNGDEEVDV